MPDRIPHTLTFVISSLSAGGAERVMSILANEWAAKGHHVTLLTFDDGKEPPFYELDSRIHYLPLGISADSSNLISALVNNLNRISRLRKALQNSHPEAIISFMPTTNILTLLASRGLGVPVIVSERADPRMNPLGRIWEQLRLKTYAYADKIVVQTQNVVDFFPAHLHSLIRIIPNPVPKINLLEEEPSQLEFSNPFVIAIGRLSSQKGFDLLLQAFAKLRVRHPEWTLVILGEGALRRELETLRDKLNLTENVSFPGRIQNPHRLLKKADLFVMSSRWEGFPNALCEAMACGLPVISTDCPSGPRDIIREGIDGILIPTENIDALSEAMDRLMSDRAERLRLATAAPEIVERFAVDKVIGMWEEVLHGKVS